MNCVVEGNCVKAFGKAIHALSRIGDELWLDPSVKGLALRSMNSAHSAYACFFFSPLFFQHYSPGSVSEQGTETMTCKLVMKSVLSLFRCLASIERTVERCQISVGTPKDRVMIQFFCRHGITKTHNLYFQESEALQAVFASHLCPNVLKAPARLFGDMVMHFPVSQEEITLSMSPLNVSLKNYYEGGDDHMKMICTEMSLHPDEFDYFQFGGDSDITFCLKELRGLLSFAESHSLPVLVHFGTPGKPVCFSVEDMVLEATVVLATLIGSESRGPSQPTETPAQTPLSLLGCPASVTRPPLLTVSLCCIVLWALGGSGHTSPSWTAEHLGVVCFLRCAVIPVGSRKADSDKSLDIPAMTEMVASSQGSPIFNPDVMMQLLPHIDDSHILDVPAEACASATTTPASSMICSLLFRAVSSEQDDDGCAARLPVLACYSDTEEEMEEDCTRSPSL
ncbi:cell cycle checkpoint control protein RAD9B [Scomber scombrus]|uniref:cell cycle checkpoint control protein RAD9B n=1 Tax=Scomber scombrus TaxID=13677 RepID=UPI002DDBF977|nr:cell cycle checkpoint control protein RAD9B [Scomber scombrus]